jgi:putative isomerase
MRANLGWNTWDVQHVNGVVHLESGLRIRFILENAQTGERKEDFDWQHDLVYLGPHSGRDMNYAQIHLRWREADLHLTYAVETDRFVCQVDAQHAEGMALLVEVDGVWDAKVRVTTFPRGLRIYTGTGDVWMVYAAQGDDISASEQTSSGSLHLNLNRLISIDVRKEGAALTGATPDVIDDQRMIYESQRLLTSGWLGPSADGLTRSIHWNTIWEASQGRVCTPVSREWCVSPAWGGYVLFDWDTFFCALMAGLESPDLMQDNIRAILQETTPLGFVPNFGSARAASLDRSQPPVGAYVVLKAWRAMRLSEEPLRRDLLEETFERLLTWHQWWLPKRDGNHDGLLEWGSDAIQEGHDFENHTLRAAMYESGLDNSPMYDQAVFNLAASTMELADVGLNALYALDAWALSEIALEIGQNEQARKLHAEYVDLAGRINELLWNEQAGIYQNRFWDGRFSDSISPTNFYPLIAGIVPPERAQRMLREHLLNENEFWGEYVLPSIARNDPGYRQREIVRAGVTESTTDYWRGRIWGPMNFLVSEGLRRYGFDREAHEFARKSVRLFLKEWTEENHVHENYNDLSGEGDDVPNANALYHWGALLAYLGIQELADCEAWEGWRFGCLDVEEAGVRGILLEEGRLEVTSGADGLRVELDGHLVLASDKPVIVRAYRTEAGRIQFRVEGDVSEVKIQIGLFKKGQLEDRAWAKLRTGQLFELGQVQTVAVSPEGRVSAELSLPCEVEVTW